jgi:DNA-binding response OmpR family regulator
MNAFIEKNIGKLWGKDTLRSALMMDDSWAKIGQYSLNEERNMLTFANKNPWSISPRECQVLGILCQNTEKLVGREKLLIDCWQNCSVYASRSLDIFICRLRKRLIADPQVKILTIRGKGFILTANYRQD